MKDLRERVHRGETLIGCFLNLGSSLTAEIVGRAGFDWALIDLEHGGGSERDVLYQLQSLEHTPAAALVRVESHERQRFHRVLDLGAHGVMVPRIDDATEARAAVAALRYQPEGVRGVALMNRACSFGTDFESYFSTANKSLLGIMQIESERSVQNIEAIAAVEGVDVLFVGPSDLSCALGIIQQFDHPRFLESLHATAGAARKFGKAAGILISKPEDFQKYMNLGYRFIGCSSDGGLLNNAARRLAESLKSARTVCASGG